MVVCFSSRSSSGMRSSKPILRFVLRIFGQKKNVSLFDFT